MGELQRDGGGGEAGSVESEDDLGGFDEEFEPGERRIVEAVVILIEAANQVLKEASQSCMPGSSSPSGGSGGGDVTISITALEAAAANADDMAQAVDGLATSAVGGLDTEEFKVSLQKLRTAAAGFA